MWVHLGQLFMFPLSAVHTHQSWIKKDLECHNTQAYSEKCSNTSPLSGIFLSRKFYKCESHQTCLRQVGITAILEMGSQKPGERLSL